MPDFIESELRVTEHRDGDDLLSAGLGIEALRGLPVAFADPQQPTAAELRQRAIHTSWKGIADLRPESGLAAPAVPGREFQAFARIPGARQPHRVLVQVPDQFDLARPCLVVTASSGSRGIYGAIALAGGWGLPRGCAVAYTDKGTGSAYVDGDDGVALDGRRVSRGEALLEFEPEPAQGIGIKHAHSGDHPEADWGRHVLQAAQFGLAMLDRAFPQQAPFTPANTRIIACGLSNGGGAVLQAAGLDHQPLLSGVVALAPNVHSPHGRALFDYATEAALWLPFALLDARFDGVPFARDAHGQPPAAWLARARRLRELGWIKADQPAGQGAEALAYLLAQGWRETAIATAASSTVFELWRAIAAAYASAYLRRDADHMPGGFRYAPLDGGTRVDAVTRAGWWADAAGIPPGNGIGLFGGLEAGEDPAWPGLLALRELWTADAADARALREAIAEVHAALPRASLPLAVVHGVDDGLIPLAFSAEPYVTWLSDNGRRPHFQPVPEAQHFDAFLALLGFGDRHRALLPAGFAALDQLWAHLFEGASWPPAG